MTRLRWFLFSLLFCGTAFGQTIPNGNTPLTSGQVWTLTQWDTAWQAKVDVTGGSSTNQILTTPTIAGGALSGTFTGNHTLSGNVTLLGANVLSGSQSITNLAISATAVTISSGFGTSPSIIANGTLAGVVTVGTSPGTTGALTMPAAANGWACTATDITSSPTVKESAYTTTSVTLTFSAAPTAADKVTFSCVGF